MNSNSEPRNILLVDADAAFGEVLRHVLGSDYILRQTSRVEQAIPSLEAESPDAILANFDDPPEATAMQDLAQLAHAAADKDVPVSVIA